MLIHGFLNFNFPSYGVIFLARCGRRLDAPRCQPKTAVPHPNKSTSHHPLLRLGLPQKPSPATAVSPRTCHPSPLPDVRSPTQTTNPLALPQVHHLAPTNPVPQPLRHQKPPACAERHRSSTQHV